jgi:hypothetical protein
MLDAPAFELLETARGDFVRIEGERLTEGTVMWLESLSIPFDAEALVSDDGNKLGVCRCGERSADHDRC